MVEAGASQMLHSTTAVLRAPVMMVRAIVTKVGKYMIRWFNVAASITATFDRVSSMCGLVRYAVTESVTSNVKLIN